jgi:hypothetical protein
MNESSVNTVLRCFEEEKMQNEKNRDQIVSYNHQNLIADQMRAKTTLVPLY